MLGLSAYKKGLKRCSYGPLVRNMNLFKVRDFQKRQPKKGGGRI